ncbi:MAG: cell surface protein SprA, partial [Chlorobi bacterium CHB2]|nr:cell surface protein SprA [Chlorobi bacterium CHB2]
MTDIQRTAWFLRLVASLMLLAAATPAAAQDTTGRAATPTTIAPRTPSSPFTDPFPFEAYKHFVEFDSVENLVRIRETLFGQPIGQPLTLTLDQYIAERQKALERQMWDQRLKRYSVDSAALASAKSPDTTTKEKDLADIVGLPKEIKIPIPQNPLFSIFGEPTVSINVNGSVNVSAGWQWDNNNLTSINALGTTQSAPFFNQNIQVAVSGKVGDKLKLNADFDTQRALDIENQLKISFGGGPASDDDIIQSVEAGNVSLQTPSQLVGSAQALFGVKSSFKFGKLFLTALVSQKRGERKTVSVSGGSVKTRISLKPYDYAPNHFWLDTAYRNFYDRYYANQPPAATPDMAPWNLTDIEVYEQVKDGSIPSQFKAIAYADLPAVGPSGRYDASFRQLSANTVSGEVQPASFIKLEQGKHFEYDRQLGTLTIKTLQRDKIYAVAFKTSGRGTYGEFSNTRSDSTEVGVLRLIYVSNLQPGFKTLWTRQMKNIYQLQGVRNIDLGNSKITITYGIPPDTNEVLKVSGNPRLVEVLGVDRTNSSNQSVPDGEFDIRTPYFFDPTRGEITFPSTEPFRKGLRESPKLSGNAEQFVINSIYDQTREEAQQQDTRVGRYTIGGEIAGSGGNKINLGVFNLARNSIKVSANGEMLTEGLDYRVDEVFGEVTLLSPKANSATGNIQVEFEQNDFFTIAQKTLLGLRADYDLLNKRNIKSKLGMTLMQYSQSLPTNKVQIYSGEEPVTNLAVGFDGWVDFRAPFLTKAIDALPFFSTTEASNIKIGGEVAAIVSNPNNKESLVQSDAGKGAAYIDDFESGAKRQIQLGINYTLWHHSSAPLDPALGGEIAGSGGNKINLGVFNL